MTNEEMLLRALNGEELTEGTTFQPQTNKQAYLAYAVGLITDPALLPAPRTNEEVLLREYCLNGSTGGVELPELTNPATAGEIVAGFEAVDQNGEVLVGTNDVKEQNERLEMRLSGDGVLSEEFYITDARYLFYNEARLSQVNEILPLVKAKNADHMFGNSADGIFETADLSLLDMSIIEDFASFFEGSTSTKDLPALLKNTSSAKSFARAFLNCSKMGSDTDTLNTTGLDTSNAEDMRNMFQGCMKVKRLDLSSWDTSKVTTLFYAFYGCEALAELVVDNWDTSKVTTLQSLLYGCKALTHVDLSKWDTSNVENMSFLYYNCKSLAGVVDMSGWDTSKVTTMFNMFVNCPALQGIVGFSAPYQEGMAVNFPTGTVTEPVALRRLTFRTDLGEGVYSMRTPINIKYCSFQREGMVEMFNTLPDVSALGLADTYVKITITGNPCVTGTLADGTNCDMLTAEDRAIAANKGWTLVE